MYNKLIDSFIERNSKINLSSFNDRKTIELKHIQDSLFAKKIIENLDIPYNADFVDIWSGWWFPILPLAIEFPNFKFIWIESVRKKTIAVNSIIKELDLSNIEIIRERAENYKKAQFDILSARAVSYIDKLLDFSFHLVRKNWFFLFYKLKTSQEYSDLCSLSKKYKFELYLEYEYTLSGEDSPRVIYVLKKN